MQHEYEIGFQITVFFSHIIFYWAIHDILRSNKISFALWFLFSAIQFFRLFDHILFCFGEEESKSVYAEALTIISKSGHDIVLLIRTIKLDAHGIPHSIRILCVLYTGNVLSSASIKSASR